MKARIPSWHAQPAGSYVYAIATGAHIGTVVWARSATRTRKGNLQRNLFVHLFDGRDAWARACEPGGVVTLKFVARDSPTRAPSNPNQCESDTVECNNATTESES